jgi:hypothetical protein
MKTKSSPTPMPGRLLLFLRRSKPQGYFSARFFNAFWMALPVATDALAALAVIHLPFGPNTFTVITFLSAIPQSGRHKR